MDSNWKAATGGATSGVFSCTCTITSDLSLDDNNVYWAATSPAQKLFGIQQADGTKIKTGWPVTAPANVTTAAPTLVVAADKTTLALYLGATSTLAQLNFSTLAWMQDAPLKGSVAIGTINGQVSYGNSLLPTTLGTLSIFAGDTSGSVWEVDPGSFSGNNCRWMYPAGSAVSDIYYDAGTDTVQFGSAGGTVVVLKGGGAAGPLAPMVWS